MSKWFKQILCVALPVAIILIIQTQSASYAAECTIPAAGPWPLCARQGKATNNSSTSNQESTCIIPPSGPWPPCATQGKSTSKSVIQTPIAGCTIPPSGPWPPCARHGTNSSSVSPAKNTSTTQSNCRAGMSITFRDTEQGIKYLGIPWLETVNSGWYIDFGFQLQSTEKANYIRQIRVTQDLKRQWTADDTYDPSNYLPTYFTFPNYERMTASAQKNPGNIWIVGNEPDRFKFQDDMHPEIYARVYHDTYKVLKEADPTAQVAPAALVQVTPGRLQYLDIVYDTYRKLYGSAMPVDIWTAHIYPLAEKQRNGQFGPAGIALGTDPALAILQSSPEPNRCDNSFDNVYCHAEHDDINIFKQQVLAMRQWMKNHGYQNTPLIVTEVGILYPEKFEDGEFFRDELGQTFTTERVNQFLTKTSQYLESAADQSLGYPHDNYKLVQQWAWFSMYTDGFVGSGSNLLKKGWESHGVGNASALTSIGHTFKREATNQPMVANLVIDSLQATPNNDRLKLAATIRNNGNIAVTEPYDVSFYADAELTQLIGSRTIRPILHGCATSIDVATVDWQPTRKGWQNIWVKVDSAQSISEANEGDNTEQANVRWQ